MREPCKDWEDRLVSLLYEDGDEPGRTETRAHLAACAGCRAEIEQLSRTRDLLAAWPNVVNVPRVVYVNEPSGLSARFARWVGAGATRSQAIFAPVVAAAVLLLAVLAMAAVLDLEVGSDGTLRIGLLSADPGAVETSGGLITRAELREGLDDVVDYLDEVLESRSEQERRLLLAALDERVQEQGLSMSRELRGAVNEVFADIQRQNEGDLRLVFSAIDEMGVMTSAELQRINAILGSLALPRPGY